MKRYICISILGIICSIVYSQEEKKYDKMYESLKSMSNKELTNLGNSYFDNNILDSALICFTIVYSKYDSKMNIEDKQLHAHAYNRSGNIHYMMYNYVRAQDMYLKSLEICEECEYREYIPKVYNNLGNIYASFNDYKKAENYYEKGLAKSLEYDDKKTSSIILDNLIGIYCNLFENQKAIYYVNMADSLNNGKRNGFIGLSARGTIALRKGDYNSSIYYAKKAIRLADSLCLDPQFKCASLNNLANAFVEKHQNDSALFYLFQSEKIARTNGLLDMQSDAFSKLAEIGNSIKDKKLYSYYNELYRNIEDSIRNIKGFRNIKDVDFLFEMNRIDKQISAMKIEQVTKDAQLSHQRLIIFVVSTVSLLIALFLFFTYKQKKKLQYSYKDIFNKNIEIIASEKQAKLRYLKYEQELRDKNDYITKLESGNRKHQLIPDNVPADNSISLPTAAKYQNSPLDNEHRTMLIQAINDVMENTQEFCNADFTLERLSTLVDSKIKYVSQVINETYGKNFNRYVNEYRIKEARIRLTNVEEYGQYTVKAIAQSVGFKSNTNFNLLFKEITGITPSMYQNMILNSDYDKLPVYP